MLIEIYRLFFFKKTIDKYVRACYNKTIEKEGDNQMEWIFVGRIESMGFGYDEYANEDNTKCRQVWDDGYEEIFEIS